MRSIQHIYKLKKIVILILTITIFSGCYFYPEIDENSYSDYRRVIGPDGGTINFYRNYEDDSIRDICVKMEFPINAIDSLLVFNMYEFYDEVTYFDLYAKLLTEQFSDFLYFVPFYESEGYREIDEYADVYSLIKQHKSIYFNQPVTITYYESFYEDIPSTARLFRIKIPAEDEWGTQNNVWVNYNYQGYPDGYDPIDLIYLINGSWSEAIPWGEGNFSLINWEEVTEYTFDYVNQSVSFDIDDTDYMYVMAVSASI